MSRMINFTNQLQSEDTFSKKSKENIRYMDTYSQRYQYRSKNKPQNKENDIRNNQKQPVTKQLKSSTSKANLVNQNSSNNYRLLTTKTEFSFIQHKEQANQANNMIRKSDYSVKNELNKAFVILKEKSMQKSKSKQTLSSNTSINDYLNKRHEEAKEKLRIIDKITKNQIEKECTFRPNISSNLKSIANNKSNDNSVFEKLAKNKQHINTNFNTDKEIAHRPVINQQSKELSRSINDLYSWKFQKDNKISEVQRKKDEDYSNSTNCSFINKKSQELIKNKKQTLSIPDSQQDEIGKCIEIEKKQEEPRQIVKHNKKQIENRDNPEYLMSIRSNLNDYYLHKKIDKQREEYKIYMTSTLKNEQKANTLRDKIEKNIQDKIKSIDYSNKTFHNLTEPYNDTLTFPNNSYKMLIKEHERLSDDNNNEPDYQSLNYVYTSNLLDKTTSLMQEYTKESKPNDQTDNNFYYSYNNMAYLNKDSDAFQTEEYLINKRKKYESEFELIEQKNNKLNNILKSNEISERGLISRL